MDSSRVLLALEEQKKWRERRKRIEQRIQQVERREAHLLRELEHVRKKIGEYAAMTAGPRDIASTVEPVRPFQTLLR